MQKTKHETKAEAKSKRITKSKSTPKSNANAKSKAKPLPNPAQQVIQAIDDTIKVRQTVLWGERMELDELNSALKKLVLYFEEELVKIHKKLDVLNKTAPILKTAKSAKIDSTKDTGFVTKT